MTPMIGGGTSDIARAGARPDTGIGASSADDAAADMRDMFTKLLVAQIRHQDPLNPSDPAQFVAQLTQMSQTEAMHEVSRRVLDQTKALGSMQAFALGSHVGRDVSVEVEHVERAEGADVRGSVALPEHTQRAEIVLRDSRGVTFRKSIEPSASAGGQTSFHLDNAWFTQQKLGAGTYSIHVEVDGQQLPVRASGRLERVHLDGAQARIDVAGVGTGIDAAKLVELSGGAPSRTS
ncbi:flagellar hook capping FlgD N-terminal domain-containing protein [Pandoraea pnomenusa]|uniref:flagellar hook assembly protein FlgD n=1 Tax=Pandoraea pnomenusa TaxID=93220 RepID=UPI00333E904F